MGGLLVQCMPYGKDVNIRVLLCERVNVCAMCPCDVQTPEASTSTSRAVVHILEKEVVAADWGGQPMARQGRSSTLGICKCTKSGGCDVCGAGAGGHLCLSVKATVRAMMAPLYEEHYHVEGAALLVFDEAPVVN